MRCALLAVVLAAFAGCATVDRDDDTAASDTALAMSPSEASAVLALVDYPGTTAATLATTIHLDSRAAKNIAAHRDGADGVSPSPDDAAFATLAQLDAIAYVGDSALGKLRSYALAHPAPAGETVETVAFAGWEVEAVTWGVNRGDPDELDAMLDHRAVTALLAKRPFADVTAMGPVAYVGATALAKLRQNARAWWNAAHQPNVGYVLTPEHLAAITTSLEEALWDDEGLATAVAGLAGGDDDLATTIMTGLVGELDRLAATLAGTTYDDADAARESVSDAAPVAQRTKLGGWTYLESIGIHHP